MPFIEVNGLSYYYQIEGSGPSLIFLHGFTGSSDNWLPLIEPFSAHFQVLLLDLPGHGRTAAPTYPERYAIDLVSRDLVAIFQALHLSAINLLGYSMGGRLALYLASKHPSCLNSLIIESASPGLEMDSQRQLRVESDNRLAEDIENFGVRTFIERWQRLPLFATQNNLPTRQRENQKLQRLNNSKVGLANSLRGMGTGQQPSLWHELKNIHLATLVIAGKLDRKFTRIAEHMAAAIPETNLRIIDGAGHNVHLEKTQPFTSSVIDFLEDLKEAAQY